MTSLEPAQTCQERCETLAGISGLVVTTRFDKDQRVFMFARPEEPHRHVKEAYTYPKAKLFAEGVRLGRELRSG